MSTLEQDKSNNPNPLGSESPAVLLPERRDAIGAIISAHIGASDCVPGTTNWASRIYDTLVELASAQTKS